jgi:hypothetical protein
MGFGVGSALMVFGLCRWIGVPDFLTGWWACAAHFGFSGQLKFSGLTQKEAA